jgi:hypothetical protein
MFGKDHFPLFEKPSLSGFLQAGLDGVYVTFLKKASDFFVAPHGFGYLLDKALRVNHPPGKSWCDIHTPLPPSGLKATTF